MNASLALGRSRFADRSWRNADRMLSLPAIAEVGFSRSEYTGTFVTDCSHHRKHTLRTTTTTTLPRNTNDPTTTTTATTTNTTTTTPQPPPTTEPDAPVDTAARSQPPAGRKPQCARAAIAIAPPHPERPRAQPAQTDWGDHNRPVQVCPVCAHCGRLAEPYAAAATEHRHGRGAEWHTARSA